MEDKKSPTHVPKKSKHFKHEFCFCFRYLILRKWVKTDDVFTSARIPMEKKVSVVAVVVVNIVVVCAGFFVFLVLRVVIVFIQINSTNLSINQSIIQVAMADTQPLKFL